MYIALPYYVGFWTWVGCVEFICIYTEFIIIYSFENYLHKIPFGWSIAGPDPGVDTQVQARIPLGCDDECVCENPGTVCRLADPWVAIVESWRLCNLCRSSAKILKKHHHSQLRCIALILWWFQKEKQIKLCKIIHQRPLCFSGLHFLWYLHYGAGSSFLCLRSTCPDSNMAALRCSDWWDPQMKTSKEWSRAIGWSSTCFWWPVPLQILFSKRSWAAPNLEACNRCFQAKFSEILGMLQRQTCSEKQSTWIIGKVTQITLQFIQGLQSAQSSLSRSCCMAKIQRFCRIHHVNFSKGCPGVTRMLWVYMLKVGPRIFDQLFSHFLNAWIKYVQIILD